MRQVLTASYMPGINAQAMVFEPATCTLEVALGTGSEPAATSRWWRVSLTAAFAAGELRALTVEQLPASVPLRHYSKQ